MSPQDIKVICEEHARELFEHADAVQIMVTWNEEGKTHRVFTGCGNWYARQGMAHELIECDKAQTNAAEIASKLEPPPDDTEAWKKP